MLEPRQPKCNFMYSRYLWISGIHLLATCSRWLGPMSVAVDAPGNDLQDDINHVINLRQCRGQQSRCIRDYVSWHIIYPKNHGPPTLNVFDYSNEVCKYVQEMPQHSPAYRTRNFTPSPIIIPNFLTMAKKNSKTVYVMATFELYPDCDIPWTRDKLVSLYPCMKKGRQLCLDIW